MVARVRGRAREVGGTAAVKKGKVYGLGSLARDSMKSVGTSSNEFKAQRRESELEKSGKPLNLTERRKMKKMEERLDAIDAFHHATTIEYAIETTASAFAEDDEDEAIFHRNSMKTMKSRYIC
ncbi:hypothetical protein NL676_001275 [Syzygium grande]|nr:hypothetical protein NL676_001275 [Syzygium grande]